MVDHHDDGSDLATLEFSLQQLRATARLRPRRERGSIARGEPEMQEGGAQEKQERRHGHEHPPWMGHDEGGEAMPESGSSIHAGGTEAGERQSIHAGAQQGEGGREKGQPIHDREDDDQGAREPQRADIPQPEHEHAEETDGHRHPREENGPPGGGHGHGEGIGHRAASNFLPEAAHDEERVVDGDAEADHGHDVRRVGRHRHVASEDLRSRDAPRHGEQPHPERKESGHHRAESEKKEERHHGQDDHLGPVKIALGHLHEIVVEDEAARRHHVERARRHQAPQGGVEPGRQRGELERFHGRAAVLQLDHRANTMPVAGDEGLIGRIEIVGGTDTRDAGIVAQRLEGALHLGLERGIGGPEGGMAEDQVEGDGPVRELARHQVGGPAGFRAGENRRGGGPGALGNHHEGGGKGDEREDEQPSSPTIDPATPPFEKAAHRKRPLIRRTLPGK